MVLPGDWQHLLAGCDASQRAAIVSDAVPLLVVAGAGSGKTRVLTRRVAWRIAHGRAVAAHVLALTYTRKAATELRARLASLGLPAPVTAGTFHAVALAELRRYETGEGRRAPVLLERKAALLGELVPERTPRPRAGRDGAPRSPAPNRRELLRTIAQEIEWAGARRLAPDAYVEAALASDRASGVDLELVAATYARFQQAKRKRGVLDFDDLLATLTRAIATDPDFAASQRWRFRHLFVDELQDATPAQLALLEAWLGGRPDLFAVGDPRQSIYGWSGADPDVVATFAQRYPGATVLRLDTNYRSTPQVVALAASTLNAGGEPAPQASRPDGRAPTLRSYDDDLAEAAGVAQLLRRAHGPGRRWSNCAVLARTNAQLVPLGAALDAAGIPWRAGNGAALLDRPSVRDALDRLASREFPFATWLADLRSQLTSPPAGDSAPDAGEEDAAGMAGIEIEELLRLGADFLETDPSPSADGFLAWARSSLRADASLGKADAVDLVTFHRAKGLEWQVVCVTGLEEGFVPIFQARTAVALEEERRLLYVALTRAVDELHCSWSAVRHFAGSTSNRQPSRFLAAVERVATDLARVAEPGSASVRATLATTRALLDARRAN